MEPLLRARVRTSHTCVQAGPYVVTLCVQTQCWCTHMCTHMRVGTCRYVWWDPGSYRQPTSGHKHTCTEQVCIPPGHQCALNTRVLCTLVCFTSCDTCMWGDRRVCVHPPHHGVCRASRSCAHVPCAGGRSGLGLRLPFAPRWFFLLVLPAPGFPDGELSDALVSAVTLNEEKCVCEEYRCCCLLLSV